MTTKIAEILSLAQMETKNSCEISLRESPGAIMKNSNGEMSVSLYNGRSADPNEIAVGMKRLKVAFPKMGNEFFNLLAERVMDNGFSSERLKHAINHVLDNFQYKELNISDIIRFDKRVRLYSYNEVCVLVSKGQASFADFEKREINGTVYRVLKSELV